MIGKSPYDLLIDRDETLTNLINRQASIVFDTRKVENEILFQELSRVIEALTEQKTDEEVLKIAEKFNLLMEIVMR